MLLEDKGVKHAKSANARVLKLCQEKSHCGGRENPKTTGSQPLNSCRTIHVTWNSRAALSLLKQIFNFSAASLPLFASLKLLQVKAALTSPAM